jgi:MFS family permease
MANFRLQVGYDTAVIGGTMALDSFKRDFGLDKYVGHAQDTLQGNIVSTFQAGTFFGALLTFPIGEQLGRKKAIMLADIIFLVGGTLMVSTFIANRSQFLCAYCKLASHGDRLLQVGASP